MNIKKNAIGFKGVTRTTYITKGWRGVSGYKTRGFRNRVRLVNRSRTYIANPEITQHVKRNRIHKMVVNGKTILVKVNLKSKIK
jgi:hypothetical protein